MASPKTRGDYDQLAQIAQCFAREQEAAQRMLSDVQQQVDTLQDGDWVGQGAGAFYAEMNSAVLPSLKRLSKALQSAQRVTQQISREIKAAEDEAAAILKDNTGNIAEAKGSGAGKGFWGQVGGFFEGLYEGGKDTVKGLWTMVTHPIETVKGLGYAITHPGEVWEALKKPYVEDWESGNQGRAIGRGAFEVLSLIVPGGAATKAGKGASVIDKLGDASRVASAAKTASKLTEVGDAARLIAKTGDYAEATRLLRAGEMFSDSGDLAKIVSRAPELEPTIQKLALSEREAMKVWDTLSDTQKFETAEAFHSARRGLELPDAARSVQRFTSEVGPSDFPAIVEKFGGDLTGNVPAQVVGKEVTALGSRDATLTAATNGERILNAAEGWTPEMNALWAKDAAARQEIIHLVTPVKDELGSLASNAERFDFTTVYARELDVFMQAGYTRVGDYLIPPGGGARVPVGAATSGAVATGIVTDRMQNQKDEP